MIKEIHGYGTSTIVIEEMIFYYIFQYDNKDRRIRRDLYSKENELMSYQTWEYLDGKLSKYSQYDINGSLEWYETYDDERRYKYDADGNLTMFTKYE